MEAQGIKETKEALIGAVALAVVVIKLSKDGLAMDDLSALVAKFVSDPEFRAKLEEGAKGIEKVPAEIKDISFAEGLELAAVLPQLLEALKGLK